MKKKTQNQLERNREIIRNIKLAFKNVKTGENSNKKTQTGNAWQTKRK